MMKRIFFCLIVFAVFLLFSCTTTGGKKMTDQKAVSDSSGSMITASTEKPMKTKQPPSRGFPIEQTVDKPEREKTKNDKQDDSVNKSDTLLTKIEMDLKEIQGMLRGVTIVRDQNGVTVTIPSDSIFQPHSSMPIPKAGKALDRLSEILSSYQDTEIAIEGHTDSRGSEFMNLDLSRQQGEFLRNRIQQKARDTEINVIPYGEKRPAISNKTESGRKRNRRMEIRVKPKF